MKTDTIFLSKKIATVAIVYFLVNAILLFKFGINLDGEALKFIENANRIINGQQLFNGVFGYFYIVYSLLVALFIKLSINLVVVAGVQIILSFYAAVCLYRLLKQALLNSSIAFLFFILYLLCYPIQKWNFFLYSESVHISLLVIGIYNFNNWATNKKQSNLLTSVVLLILISFSRPVGIIFLASVFVVLIVWLYKNKKMLQFYMLIATSIVAVIIILNSPFTAFVNPDSIRRMEIICMVPEANITATYKEYNREGLYKAFTVIKDEVGFGNFFKAGLKKVSLFFGLCRSYYSWRTNGLLMLYYILYPFALIGIFSKRTQSFYYLKVFSVLYIFITTLLIFVTCDEWSNRFVAPVFPFILMLAAQGFWVIRQKYIKREFT